MSITLVILCFLHGWRLLKEGGRERGFLYIALSVILLAVVFACFSGDIFLLPLVGVPYLLYCNKIPDTRMVQVILCLVPVVSIGLGVCCIMPAETEARNTGNPLIALWTT